MRYWYVPSTYRGRKYGRGIYGGAIIGVGRIVGGSLADLHVDGVTGQTVMPVDIPVAVPQVVQNIEATAPPSFTADEIAKAKAIIEWAEKTGKPEPITQKQAGFWSGLKNLGSKVWSGVKTVASNPIVQGVAKAAIPMALGALAPYAPAAIKTGVDWLGTNAAKKLNDWGYGNKAAKSDATSVSDNLSAAMTNLGAASLKGIKNTGNAIVSGVKSFLPTSWFGSSGSGYGGRLRRLRAHRRGRLRKGSIEAKRYMAMLRAKRRTRGGRRRKRGGAIIGLGMFEPNRRMLHMQNFTNASPRVARAMRKIGLGYSGGILPGWTEDRMEEKIDHEENVMGKHDNDIVSLDWVDKWGKPRETEMTLEMLKQMLEDTHYMKNYYSYDTDHTFNLGRALSYDEESDKRSETLGEGNWGKNTFKAHPYKYYSKRRRRRIKKKMKAKFDVLKLINYFKKRSSKLFMRKLFNARWHDKRKLAWTNINTATKTGRKMRHILDLGDYLRNYRNVRTISQRNRLADIRNGLLVHTKMARNMRKNAPRKRIFMAMQRAIRDVGRVNRDNILPSRLRPRAARPPGSPPPSPPPPGPPSLRPSPPPSPPRKKAKRVTKLNRTLTRDMLADLGTGSKRAAVAQATQAAGVAVAASQSAAPSSQVAVDSATQVALSEAQQAAQANTAQQAQKHADNATQAAGVAVAAAGGGSKRKKKQTTLGMYFGSQSHPSPPSSQSSQGKVIVGTPRSRAGKKIVPSNRAEFKRAKSNVLGQLDNILAGYSNGGAPTQSSSSSSSMSSPSQVRQTPSRSMSPPLLAASSQSSSTSSSSSSSAGLAKGDIDELKEQYNAYRTYCSNVLMVNDLYNKCEKYLARIKEALDMAYKAYSVGDMGGVTNLCIKANTIMEKLEHLLIKRKYLKRSKDGGIEYIIEPF